MAYEESPVGEVAIFRNSLRKPVTAADRKPGPYPYYGAAEIQDWVQDYLFEGLHVLVGEDGTVQTADGRPMIQLVDGQFWVNNHAHVIHCEADLDTRFLAYALNQVQIAPFVTGAAQPKLNMGNLKRVTVNWPKEKVRRDISLIGKSLDDRIDHNRALAANLEAIARRLFKSWFVDFDPVRAKAAGEKPAGLADDIAALFPDRFVESELGEIPEGWNTVALSQLAEVERGLSYKGSGLADRETGMPMHNLNSVLEGGGYKYQGIKYYSGDYKAQHIAKAGDIIVANTEQGHKHLLIGFPAIIPASYEEGLFSHHLYRVRILRDAKTTKNWLYYALMASDVREQIIGHANGSTVNMLKRTGLQVPLVVLPPLALCEHFEAVAASIRALIENCVAESTALSQLRDLLLPRLISGKLRLTEVWEAVSEATT